MRAHTLSQKHKRGNALLHILTKVIQKKRKCNEKREFNKLQNKKKTDKNTMYDTKSATLSATTINKHVTNVLFGKMTDHKNPLARTLFFILQRQESYLPINVE